MGMGKKYFYGNSENRCDFHGINVQMVIKCMVMYGNGNGIVPICISLYSMSYINYKSFSSDILSFGYSVKWII